MTIERIYKLAQRKFKDLNIDDLSDPCMYAIDNIYEKHFVVILRLNPSSYDKMFEEDARMIISSIHEEPDPMDFCPFKVGDRIGQMVIFETKRAELTEVDELTDSERGSGGFGHTGN